MIQINRGACATAYDPFIKRKKGGIGMGDAYAPAQIALRAEAAGVAKARLSLARTGCLGVLAGAFIALGGAFYTLIVSDPTLGFAYTRVLGGLVFSVGLVMVVVGGGELFTGNNLLAIAWADGRISWRQVGRNWLVALAANALGAGAVAVLVSASGYPQLNAGLVGETAVRIAASKTALPFDQAFFAGVLCNLLVCMAVWLALAGRSVVDKVVGVMLPVAAFVAAGFEHSVANMYFIPLGLLLKDSVDALGTSAAETLTWAGYVRSLVPVLLGNVVGGSGLVALFYFFAYRFHTEAPNV